MSLRTYTVAAALALSLASFDQAQAAGGASFTIPAVIGAAYHDARVATNPGEVRRQGGFATPTAVQRLPEQQATN